MLGLGRKQYFRALAASCAILWATPEVLSADLGSGSPAEETPAPPPQQWTLSFTPYGWLSALNGHTTVKDRTTDVDVGPIELLEHLHGAPWMSYAEARNGRFSLYSDIIYAPLSTGASGVRTVGPLALAASLGVDIRQTIAEAGATYEIGRWNAFGGSSAVDLLAGARYWQQDVAIKLALSATLDVSGLTISRGRAIARAGSVDWVDPLVGLRLRHQLMPGQELVLRGDVGGFDAGSQFSWNVLAAYSLQLATQHGVTYSAILGYRALGVDFEKGSGSTRYDFDMVQHGPVLGLMVSF